MTIRTHTGPKLRFTALALAALWLAPGCKGADGTEDEDGVSDDNRPDDPDAGAQALAEWGSADLSGEDAGTQWANMSAPEILYMNIIPIMFVSFAAENEEDPCPTVVESDDHAIYEGGCTDAEGNIWEGRMTSSGSGLVFEDLSISSPDEECGGYSTMSWNGRITATGMPGSGLESATFHADTRIDVEGSDEQCQPSTDTLAWDYEATMEEEPGDDTWERWNGSGRIGNSEDGSVAASTVDMIIDTNLCDTEPASGDTYIESGSTELRYAYDGETDCNGDGRINWYRNGEDMGRVEGYMCATSPASAGLLAVFLGALGLGRRREG